MSVSKKTIEEVFDRDKNRCVICKAFSHIENFPVPKTAFGSALEKVPHHGLFLSRYKKQDRDKAWNLHTICVFHHRMIHGGIRVLKENLKFTKIAEDYCVNLSRSRKPKEKTYKKPGKRKVSHDKKMGEKYPFQPKQL